MLTFQFTSLVENQVSDKSSILEKKKSLNCGLLTTAEKHHTSYFTSKMTTGSAHICSTWDIQLK